MFYFSAMKHFLNLTLLSCLFFSFSCNTAKEELPPADLIAKEQMASLLADLALTEATLNLNADESPLKQNDSTLIFNTYKQHRVSRQQYESSMSYYSKHPKEFGEIYSLVIDTLNAYKQKIQPKP